MFIITNTNNTEVKIFVRVWLDIDSIFKIVPAKGSFRYFLFALCILSD